MKILEIPGYSLDSNFLVKPVCYPLTDKSAAHFHYKISGLNYIAVEAAVEPNKLLPRYL